MKTILSRIFTAAALVAFAFLPVAAFAQQPDTLKHSILPPPLGVQSGARLGTSVAVDGGYTVVGAPYDDSGALDTGVVKVFDSTTGALLFLLNNPSPEAVDQFGKSVAISGTRVVVGTPYDNPMGVRDAGSAYVYDLASGTPTVPVATLTNLGLDAFDEFGLSVAISGTRVTVAAHGDQTEYLNAGSVFIYDLASGTPTVPVVTLNNPGPASFDDFGFSVAISGTRVVVGAYRDDTGASDAGSAYVYDLTNGTPTVPVATFINPGPAAGDNFGFSVAISGTRVVVGAYLDNTGATDAGSAYVYDLTNGTPTVPVATFINPGPAAGDNFGSSVAISGTRVVVGTPYDDTGAGNAGGAYAYDLAGVTPTVPVATLNNPGSAAGDNFGWSVAISSTRVVVGSPYDDTGADNAGSVYAYELPLATPTLPLATLNNPGPATNDLFGYSVAISGTRMVVGAYQDDTGASDAGSAYVYDLASGTPTVPVAILNHPAPSLNQFFGMSVAISGMRVVVGASRNSNGETIAGSAYVYDLASGTPTVPVTTLNNPGPASWDYFGRSVAISGTLVVVGTPGDDTGADGAGSAYVYELASGTPTVPVATLNNPSPATWDNFGLSVAISGTRVVVGVPYDETSELVRDAGRACVYDMASSMPTVPVATLNNPSPSTEDTFGWSVAISGTRVVVGAHLDNTGASDAGSAYVYDLTSGTPTVPVATLNKPGPAAGSRFGWSVAVSGTRVVVGAIYENTGANTAGSAYVYDLANSIPTVPVVTLNNPSPAEHDQFGTSVAIDGTSVAIGAAYDDSPQADKGSAYVFGPRSVLESWQIAKFGSISNPDAAMGFDKDKDGLSNLLEYAFKLEPQVPGTPVLTTLIGTSGLPKINPVGSDPSQRLRLEYVRMKASINPGITYTPQFSSNLLGSGPSGWANASGLETVESIDNQWERVVIEDATGTGLPNRFGRVWVTQP